MSLDTNKTYLVWNGTEFPNSANATFKAPAGSTIDWGDGKSEEFSTETAAMHTYDDGKIEHTIAIIGLTSFGDAAFSGCSSLKSVIIGNNVTNISYGAFYSCSSLTSIIIPDSVTSIGNSAFSGCSSLTSVTIGNSVTSIGNMAFYDCRSLKSVTIPDSVTNISRGVFGGCSSLKSVIIGNSVTSISDGGFYNCSNLTSITIGNSVTSIGNSAFSGCSSLKSVTIPDSVTSILNWAFYACDKLTQIILFPSTPPTLSSNAIPNNVQSIYVQQSSKAAYQAETNWKAFATKIVSDNIYLSFVRFNQKNKEYINEKISESTPSSSVNVVQNTGSSETDVMSQKAVTENFLLRPNGLPVETSLVTVSPTGTHAWKPVSELGITAPIHKSELDSDLQTSINSIANKLDKPASNPTEDSVVTVSSTGNVSYKPLSEFAVTTTTPVTIPWSNLKTTNGITDQVRNVMTNLYEHSLYLRFIYNSWHAEAFVTLLSNSDTEVTDYAGITNILGDTFYHEASGIITNPIEGEKYSVGYIQNISHNGLKVLIPN